MPFSVLEAAAVWKWFNAVESHAACKQVLRISVDETSLSLLPKQRRGHVFGKSRCYRKASLSTRRTCFTHLACVVDDPAIQKVIPQFVILNERTCSASQLVAIERALPENFTAVRQKSAWNNNVVCAQFITALGKALAPYLGSHHLVLIWDAAKIHSSRQALGACRDAGLHVISVPPPTTSKLQVLDTHVFSSYKQYLAEELQCVHMAGTTAPDVEVFFKCVGKAVKNTFEQVAWGKAFDDNGFGQGQRHISKRVREALGQSTVVSGSLCRSDVELCFPRKVRIHWDLLLPFPLIHVRSQWHFFASAVAV